MNQFEDSDDSISPVDNASKDPSVKYYVKVEPNSTRISRSGASSLDIRPSPSAVETSSQSQTSAGPMSTSPTGHRSLTQNRSQTPTRSLTQSRSHTPSRSPTPSNPDNMEEQIVAALDSMSA